MEDDKTHEIKVKNQVMGYCTGITKAQKTSRTTGEHSAYANKNACIIRNLPRIYSTI